MKEGIHPAYAEIKVNCSCGNKFTTRSTAGKDLHLEICSKCHPFYTGKQKVMDTAGRVDSFVLDTAVKKVASATAGDVDPRNSWGAGSGVRMSSNSVLEALGRDVFPACVRTERAAVHGEINALRQRLHRGNGRAEIESGIGHPQACWLH